MRAAVPAICQPRDGGCACSSALLQQTLLSCGVRRRWRSMSTRCGSFLNCSQMSRSDRLCSAASASRLARASRKWASASRIRPRRRGYRPWRGRPEGWRRGHEARPVQGSGQPALGSPTPERWPRGYTFAPSVRFHGVQHMYRHETFLRVRECVVDTALLSQTIATTKKAIPCGRPTFTLNAVRMQPRPTQIGLSRPRGIECKKLHKRSDKRSEAK